MSADVEVSFTVTFVTPFTAAVSTTGLVPVTVSASVLVLSRLERPLGPVPRMVVVLPRIRRIASDPSLRRMRS